MEQEIIDSVLQLLKEGGHAAFVLVLVYWVLGFFKPIILVGMVVGCVFVVVSRISGMAMFTGRVANAVGTWAPLSSSEEQGILDRLRESVKEKPWGH